MRPNAIGNFPNKANRYQKKAEANRIIQNKTNTISKHN